MRRGPLNFIVQKQRWTRNTSSLNMKQFRQASSEKCAHNAHARVREDPALHPAFSPWITTRKYQQCGLLTSAHPRERVCWVGAAHPQPEDVLRVKELIATNLCALAPLSECFRASADTKSTDPAVLFFFSSLSEPGPAHCHACAQSSTPNTPSQFATVRILAVCSVIVLVKPFDAQSWRILLSLSFCLVVQAHFKWRKYHTSNRRHLLFLTQHSPRSRNMQIVGVWKWVCQIVIELERQGGGKKGAAGHFHFYWTLLETM